ncbi:tautomerase family protein [Photobacterium atrarenae]|uniref:4-oxalocrotonate tautomerase family protein n=1 Tax=Photobacterium atrarenae TaxID=865757 RepID=A0ABY5GNY4_9GAMM|nr:tautomerase family protein [Photobacterium atrarenae]UTV30795.1 4-oxalocrotonate tautomerase family protein [Photobacterium atrarenae]
MPKLDLTLNTELPEETVSQVVTGLTELTQTLLNKQPDVTRIHVHQNQSLCYVNAAQVTGPSAFNLAIYITEGTNTEEQKAQWLQATYQLLNDVLGEGAPQLPNYISIHELDARDWGYNGLSQFARNR